MKTEEMKKRLDEWINYCLRSDQFDGPPYIDVRVEVAKDFEWIWSVGRDRSSIQTWRDLVEERLVMDPANSRLRFAVLCLFLDGGLSNPYEKPPRSNECHLAFRHLAGLCIPEQLTRLAELKFELYNAYLAANWDRASEILRRIAILDLLSIRELSLLRGQFWFMSVFGRRIEFELSNRNCEYEFYWTPPLSSLSEGQKEADEALRKTLTDLYVFARPELLTWGSAAHWALTAWCANPRAPKAIRFEPDPIFFHDPEEASAENVVEKDGLERLRQYEHEQYREFTPISPPHLSEHQRGRLTIALSGLQEGIALDNSVATAYTPLIARTLFCLKRFEESAEAYRRLIELRCAFADVTSRTEDTDWEWKLCFHRSLCLRHSGNHEAAISVLTEFAERRTVLLPDPINKAFQTCGTGWWIAKWYSEMGRYHEAARCLKNELESFFSPPESWELSTILVLDSVSTNQEELTSRIRQYIEGQKEIQQILTGIISDFWPTFASLSPEASSHWLVAVYLNSAECPLKDASGLLLNNAVREYGWVLEHELKTRFLGFRKEIQNDHARRLQAEEDYKSYPQDKFYWFLTRKPEITLGMMAAAIRQSEASNVETDVHFGRFLRTHAPGLTQLKTALDNVIKLRNQATHDNVPCNVETVRKMSADCRSVLTCLFTR